MTSQDNKETIAKAFFEQGIAFGKDGKFDEAIAELTNAIEAIPNNAEYYLERGICYWYKNNYNSAMVDYNKAIEIMPKYPQGIQ